jgi:MFS family permease
MVIMTLISIPLMDRSGRRTLHLYGLGGMFIFSIFITISFLVKVEKNLQNPYYQ